MSCKVVFASLLILAPLMACSESRFDLTASNRQDVLYGKISGPEDDAVVKLESVAASGTMWGCTGTLVAPNLVLTARHCIANFVDGRWTCDANGNLSSG